MPERMCVGCRGKSAQQDLVRVVAGPRGLELDPRRVAPGRGAYLHPDAACLARALRTRALGRALRVVAPPDAAFAETFAAAAGGGPA